LDIETRRKKQQALMVRMVERRVRSRAQQLYESRGRNQGQDLQDWFQAESEVLGNSIVAPLYRRFKNTDQHSEPADNVGEPTSSGEIEV
jgi:Protein of unknown function (DUF2934)